MPNLSKPKVLELARGEWIDRKFNCCLVGSHGTGKTHISVGLGLAACRAGLRVRFFTAAELVNRLEKEPARLVGVNNDTVTRLALLAGRHAKATHDELAAFSPGDPQGPVR